LFRYKNKFSLDKIYFYLHNAIAAANAAFQSFFIYFRRIDMSNDKDYFFKQGQNDRNKGFGQPSPQSFPSDTARKSYGAGHSNPPNPNGKK
jgi:hypothetical protein